MAHLARKAFHPGKLPLPLMHVDTGHNLRETMEFRDRYMQELDATLVVASVQKMIDEGRLEENTGPHASRNGLQIPTLLSAVEEHGFDYGQWEPKGQRTELWDLYNGAKKQGESFRVFPLSNWTEIDVWRYIREEQIPLPNHGRRDHHRRRRIHSQRTRRHHPRGRDGQRHRARQPR